MRRAAVLFLVTGVVLGCRTAPVRTDEEVIALQRVREQHRQAHLNGDAALLVSTFAGDFLSIQGGDVSSPSSAESLERFRSYFGRVTFLAWDDLEPPVIRISGEGDMAWAVVRKRVIVAPRKGADDSSQEETIFAWLETWGKVAGEWKLKALASTRRPLPE